MPTVSAFHGILIRMWFSDHPQPHFQADGWTICWPGNVDLSPDMLYGRYEPASGTRFERRIVHPGRDAVA